MISDKEARDSLLKLVEHVLLYQGRPIPSISYQELAVRIGRLDKHDRGHGHGMGGIVLKKMGSILDGVSVGWNEPIPDIQCLVGGKNDPQCLPDDGIREFWPEYDHLSRAEKMVRVNLEKQRIAVFGSRWNNVLQFLKIGKVELPPIQRRVFGSGGESPEHKALKEFVKQTPSLFGVQDGAQRFAEYPLPSMDVIDVLFKEQDKWTAVEVKSTISDGVSGDYERGVYQTIKYQAILNAMRSDHSYGVPERIKVFLVLESCLPPTLGGIARTLGVNVLEKARDRITENVRLAG